MFCVVFVTCPNMTEARKVAKNVLTKELAACVNMAKGIESMYWWEGKIHCDRECLLIIKSKKNLFPRLTEEIKSTHSYSNPEIISFALQDGNADYLKWIDDCCQNKEKVFQ